MITSLKPYPEYKESDISWMGKIPKVWNLVRLGSVLVERNELNTNDRINQVLSVLKNVGVIRYEDKGRIGNKKSEDTRRYKIVRPDDIVVNCMNVIIGSVGLSRYTGCLSPVYYVLKPRSSENFASYFAALFAMKPFHESLVRIGNGIMAHRMRIPMELLKCEMLPLPKPDEQKAIVKFLNWANGRLEKAIRAKRKIIALLNEQKQAIIHRAVTRGLDPNVPLKPSGISWLGDIPQHWEIVRNMAIFAQRIEQGIPGFPVLQVSLHSGITAEEVDQFGRPKRLIADVTKYKLLRRGDLAYNTMRMWQGAVGVAPFDGLVSPAYVVIKPRIDICPKFYEFFFRTECYKQQINRQSTGIVSDRNRLYWDSFKQMPNLKIPMFEQEKIVEFIFAEVSGLNKAVRSAEQEICFLREFRTRLVADVVTGKLDIREAAAGLPKEETNEPEEIFKDIETTEEEFENEQE